MHLTLKLEATKPAAKNFLQQQARFDDFIDGYNNERPHQALNMQCPAQRYRPSSRPYRGLPDIDYCVCPTTVPFFSESRGWRAQPSSLRWTRSPLESFRNSPFDLEQHGLMRAR
jgi:hypothetical protein